MGAHICRVLGWMDLSDLAWLGEIGLQHQVAGFTAGKLASQQRHLSSFCEDWIKVHAPFQRDCRDTLCASAWRGDSQYIHKKRGNFFPLLQGLLPCSVLIACPAASRAGKAGQEWGCETGTERAGEKSGNSQHKLTGDPHLFPYQMFAVLPVETGGRRELPISL